MKLELQDIDKEMKNSDAQINLLKDKIVQEEKQMEQLTQASDAAKVITILWSIKNVPLLFFE